MVHFSKWLVLIIFGCCLLPNDSISQVNCPNPDLQNTTCSDLDVILILDESGSIDEGPDGEFNEQSVRDAALGLATGLAESGAKLAIIEFATTAEITGVPGYNSGYNEVTFDFVNDLESYLNTNYQASGFTNWEDAFTKALELQAIQTADLLVFVTDGNPTAYINDGQCFSCAISNNDACFNCSNSVSLDKAIPLADQLKCDGTHLFGLAVGVNISLPSIEAVTGPDQDIVPGDGPPPDPSFSEADYTSIPFSELVECLSSIAEAACDPCEADFDILDFSTDGNSNPLTAGDIPTNAFDLFGISISSDDPVSHPPMIFNSSSPSNAEFGLGSPNTDFGGPGIGQGGASLQPGINDLSLGNILILSEDGSPAEPSTLNSQGTLIFDFANPQDLTAIEILNVPYGIQSAMITAFDDGNSVIGQSPVLGFGPNSVQLISIDFDDASRLEVELPSGSAISRLVLCDFVNLPSIGDLIYVDGDCDDVPGNTQNPVSGAQLQLLNLSGDLIAQTTSDINGMYSFPYLNPGAYQVQLIDSSIPSDYFNIYDFDSDEDNNSGLIFLQEDDELAVDFGYETDLLCCELTVECPPASGGLFSCFSEVPAPDPESILITDQCSTPTITLVEEITGFGCVNNPGEVKYNYVIVDPSIYDEQLCGDPLDLESPVCDGRQICTIIHTVRDDEAPVLTGQDFELFIDCDDVATPETPPTAFDNCSGTVDVSEHFEIVPSECENEWFEIYSYNATDDCGNSSVRTYTYHYQDIQAPTLLGIPQDATVLCDEIPDPAIVFAQDNCDQNVTVSLTANTVQLECGFELTRTWTAIDDCGNTSSESQLLTLLDVAAPVLIGVPDDQFYSCNGSYPAEVINVDDNCDSDVPITIEEVLVGDNCNYSITYTYSAADDCENSVSESYTVNVLDTTAPIISEADIDLTLQCDEQPTIVIPTATDECDQNFTFEDDFESIPGNCPNERTDVYTWTATDACGNQSVRTYIYRFVDDTSPILQGIPQDATVLCDEVPDPAIVFAQDNCDPSITVSLNAETIELECGYQLTRTWSATDLCGNSNSEAQILTLLDETAPVLSPLPDNQFALCDGDYPPAEITVSDNCDNTIDLIINEDIVGEGCEYTITYTYFAEDNCGNAVEDSYSIEVLDLTPPTISLSDIEINLECDDQPTISVPTVSDNCDPNVILVEEFESLPGNCPNSRTDIYRWTATDACGNTAVRTYIYHFSDGTAPQLIGVPQDATVDCEAIPDPAIVLAQDNCDPAITVSLTASTVDLDCGFELTRTWTATDQCGNTSDMSQVLTIIDTVAPEVTCPNEYTVNCDQGSSDPEFAGTPLAADNCSNFIFDFEDGLAGDICPATFERTWFAIDDCGNTSSCIQLITINDFAAPSVNCPDAITVECSESLDPLNTGELFAIDDCSVPIISFLDSEEKGICPYSFIRQWQAIDPCGNSSSCEQEITVVDTQAPTISEEDLEITLSCDQQPTIITPIASDNCADIDLVEDFLSIEGECPGSRTDIYTYTAADDCGNTVVRTYTYHFVDDLPPSLLGVPQNLEVQCDEVPDPAIVFAQDNCDSNVPVSLTASTIPLECGFELTRTWTATDDCGNTSVAVQILLVNDVFPPTMIGVPQDASFQCGDIPDPAIVFAEDNCTSNLPVSLTASTVFFKCGFELTRTWTAVDDCGNATVGTQVLTVFDDTPPIITCPDNYSPEEEGAYDPDLAGYASATDNCSDATVSYVDLPPEPNGNIERIWTALDSCGNESSCVQIILFVSCESDFNGDGFVTTNDLLFFLSDFGCLDSPCPTDLNGDGISTLADLLIFLTAYGSECE